MKTSLILTKIFTLIFLMSCNAAEDDKFILTGRIENAGEIKSIQVYEGEAANHSIELDRNGEFNFEGSAPGATLYTLLVGQRPFMLILKNGEEVEFIADLKDPGNYTVTGSKTSVKMKELDTITETFREQQNNLQMEFEQRMNAGEETSAIQHDLTAKNDSYISELSKQVLPFSFENQQNLAGFYGILTLYSVDPTGHEQEMIKYMENIQGKFPENEEVQRYAAQMEEIKPLSIGQQAPDFSSLTPEGEEVSLSDFRGQYVLLDFWAAWCAPCREENPNIVAQYHKFKDKGFTVLGLSLDRDRDAWLKAIEDDKLEWTQLSDLKMWDSGAGRLYNITAIPASFMIDPDGKIIGKNLRGPALEQFLENNL
ncbi:MAG: TlpA disulfide reductase family protein [Anditalea sp.]